MSSKVLIVPEPKKLKFTNRWFEFDGFVEFPSFLAREFKIPQGSWRIKKVNQKGTGLKVSQGEIQVWGEEKVYYATIIQLIKQRKHLLPEVIIEEKLFFPFRGYHLDIARGGVPKVETFKRLLRWLFLLKYNYFAIYFEDLFPWKKYPMIGLHRGRLSTDELREIINYGNKLGIEVFPSLELTGHMEHILSLPEFRKLSEWHNPYEGCLDVSNEEAVIFVQDLLKEVIDFFPSKYIHIGGDETWALGRGKSLNKTGVFEGPKLYEDHHKRLIKIVMKKGKTPILWGDMITGMYLKGDQDFWKPLMKSELWKSAVIANWDYSPSPERHFEEKINLLKEMNLTQIVCPGLANWNRYYPNFRMAIENLKNFLAAAKKLKTLGFLVTAWGDDGEECLFKFLYPLILASMEIAEGNGRWEEKWLALSGEDEKVLDARKMFGEPEISENIKHILLADYRYYRLSDSKRKAILSKIDEALNKVKNVNLPLDLFFIRACLEVCLRRLKGVLTSSDFLALSQIYAKLWLEERKPEGLERIISRLWGSAGRVDLKLK